MKNLHLLHHREKKFILDCAIRIKLAEGYLSEPTIFDKAEEMHEEAKKRGLFDENGFSKEFIKECQEDDVQVFT